MMEETLNTYLLNLLIIPRGQLPFDQMRDLTSFMRAVAFSAQLSFISIEPIYMKTS